MTGKKHSRLRFNMGFLLDAGLGTSRQIDVNYPEVQLEDVLLQPVVGTFQATRTSKGIYVAGLLRSFVETDCARCLEDFIQPIEIELDDLFYFRNTAPEDEYEVGEDGNVDLGPLVRELSLLAVPMTPFCRPDCLGLCDQCGQNLNEAQCDCPTDQIDPRLVGLKKLLDN